MINSQDAEGKIQPVHPVHLDDARHRLIAGQFVKEGCGQGYPPTRLRPSITDEIYEALRLPFLR